MPATPITQAEGTATVSSAERFAGPATAAASAATRGRRPRLVRRGRRGLLLVVEERRAVRAVASRTRRRAEAVSGRRATCSKVAVACWSKAGPRPGCSTTTVCGCSWASYGLVGAAAVFVRVARRAAVLVADGVPSRVPLRGVVRARVEGLRAHSHCWVRSAATARSDLSGWSQALASHWPLASGPGGLRRDAGELLVAGRPGRRVVRPGVVGGVVLGRVRVVVQRLVAARGPLRGVVRAGAGVVRPAGRRRGGRSRRCRWRRGAPCRRSRNRWRSSRRTW